jgi:hypothetical protein
MTVQEVIDAQHELEQTLAKALVKFESESKCRVEHIDIERVFVLGVATQLLVETEVRLPCRERPSLG